MGLEGVPVLDTRGDSRAHQPHRGTWPAGFVVFRTAKPINSGEHFGNDLGQAGVD